ncbi:MAG: glycosyltransferase family 4 protein [Actinomycetota bacterium]|nr:glycosyltransferase family 4 protein [Actinomycetota bacterium]
MNARPRLVHLTTTDMSLSLLLGPQLRAFAEAGYEVIGVSSTGPFVPELTEAGIRHVPLANATRANSPGRDARALAELQSLLRRLRPAIVHTHNPKPGIYGRLAAAAAGVPGIVNTVHGLYALPEDRWTKRALVYGLERLAALCSHVELVQNPEDVEVLARLGVPRSKLQLLGNGIDLARFDRTTVPAGRVEQLRREIGAGPDDVVCGAVGRLVWEKGYAAVFEAAAAVRRRLPHARFVVVGPSDRDKSDALSDDDLARAREQAGIVFLGMRKDLTELYAAMDIYVLASHREGFPRSAMEAAALGLPIVATDIRGCRQVVDSGTTGLLVPPRDARALADAVTTLVTDADLRRRMGRAAAGKARREFDQQRIIDITLEVYRQILHGERDLPRLRTRRPARAGTA